MGRTVYDPLVEPELFHVYVTVQPTKRNSLKEPITFRIGAANTEDEIKAKIEKDKAAMSSNLGGVIDPTEIKNRVYRVFKSRGWDEVKL